MSSSHLCYILQDLVQEVWEAEWESAEGDSIMCKDPEMRERERE